MYSHYHTCSFTSKVSLGCPVFSFFLTLFSCSSLILAINSLIFRDHFYRYGHQYLTYLPWKLLSNFFGKSMATYHLDICPTFYSLFNALLGVWCNVFETVKILLTWDQDVSFENHKPCDLKKGLPTLELTTRS